MKLGVVLGLGLLVPKMCLRISIGPIIKMKASMKVLYIIAKGHSINDFLLACRPSLTRNMKSKKRYRDLLLS